MGFCVLTQKPPNGGEESWEFTSSWNLLGGNFAGALGGKDWPCTISVELREQFTQQRMACPIQTTCPQV